MKLLKELVKPPDYVTLTSTSSGILSIFASISHEFEIAATLLIAAVLFDRLDGKLAKFLGLEERDFGKELDSLSDAVSFGVAPAVFGYTLGLGSFLEIIVLLFFVCCGVLRLARFNVIKAEEGYYQGMNITYNGLIFPLLYFMTSFPSILEAWRINILLFIYVVSGLLMISSIRWKKI